MSAPQTLDELLALMRDDDPRVLDVHGDWCSDLPTFGGEPPADTVGIWSWDASRIIRGECADDLVIESVEAVPVASAYRLKLHNGVPDEEFGTIGEAREAARVRLGWAAVYTGGWDTCGTEAGGYHESAVLYPAIDKAIADADYGGPVIVAIAAEQ